MINVGLVGFGLSGRYLQSPFFLTNPSFNLSGIVTSQEIPKEYFARTQKYLSFNQLIEDPSIDLISICSPNSTHFEYCKLALEAGKHVLVEKPITASSKEAKVLYELAKSNNKVLAVFQNRRYDGDFMTVKKVIESGVLGEILSYEAHFDRYNPVLNTKKWKETIGPASGILYDLGSHMIDQAISIFGKPQSIFGESFTQREGSEIEDAFDLRMDYGKLKVTIKSSLLVKDEGPRYKIHGTKGTFTKFGFDVQESQLRSGWFPNMPGFGAEEPKYFGSLKTSLGGMEFTGTIDTIPGNWDFLFIDLANSIQNQTDFGIKHEDIITQIEIIEQITT